MDSRYLYPSSRIKALETTLLSENQVERLYAAENTNDERKVLADTFLAPYIADPEKNIQTALEECMEDTKKMLASIAPEPELLDILWLRYDFLNLKTIVKGKRAGLSHDDILNRCSGLSKWDPRSLLEAFENTELAKLDTRLAKCVERSTDVKNIFEIDISKNLSYFDMIKEITRETTDSFIHDYTKTRIDLFNLKSALRRITLQEMTDTHIFVNGGNILGSEDISTKEQIIARLSSFGGEDTWKEALDSYETTGDHSLLERVADETLLSWLQEAGRNLNSPAPLFSYFEQIKHNTQIIRTITVAKANSLSEREIRNIVRNNFRKI